MNSRHPDPRRVWKVGSGPRLLPPLSRDSRDPGDPRDPGMRSDTSIFDNPSVDFDNHVGKHEQSTQHLKQGNGFVCFLTHSRDLGAILGGNDSYGRPASFTFSIKS